MILCLLERSASERPPSPVGEARAGKLQRDVLQGFVETVREKPTHPSIPTLAMVCASRLGPLAAVAEDGRRVRADAAHEPDVVQARSGAAIPSPRASAPHSRAMDGSCYFLCGRGDARGPPSRAILL